MFDNILTLGKIIRISKHEIYKISSKQKNVDL